MPLQVREYGQRGFERTFRGAVRVEHGAQIDDIDDVDAEIAQIVVHGLRQFLAREGGNTGSICTAPGADLGHDDEILWIGMQCLADDLIGDVRTVKVAGVDVVHAAGDGLAQHGEGRSTILGRAEHAGPCKLHGAIAEPFHLVATEGVSA